MKRQPAVRRKEAAQHSLRDLVDRFFAGSTMALVSQLLESQSLRTDEVQALKQEIDSWLQSRSHDGRRA